MVYFPSLYDDECLSRCERKKLCIVLSLFSKSNKIGPKHFCDKIHRHKIYMKIIAYLFPKNVEIQPIVFDRYLG